MACPKMEYEYIYIYMSQCYIIYNILYIYIYTYCQNAKSEKIKEIENDMIWGPGRPGRARSFAREKIAFLHPYLKKGACARLYNHLDS